MAENKKLKGKILKYVKKYAKDKNITVEDALEHEIVKNVIAWYELQEKGEV